MMAAQVSYFDVAAALARRQVFLEDPTEHAMHASHGAVIDFEYAIQWAKTSERLQQLAERAEVQAQFWQEVFEQARDKRMALQQVGL